MWLLQDKITVTTQSTQPKRWTQPQNQQSITNRHVSCDAVLHEHLLHRIFPAMTAFTLIIFNLHGSVNEPYGRVVHPTNDDMSKVNQDDSSLDSTNGPQVVDSSSGDSRDDDEDDPFNWKLHNNEWGGDESPANRNENGFTGEPVDVSGSDDPDDFPNIVLDDDMDIVEDDMVEVDIVDETEEEDMVGLWEE